ncbi:MAG: hypothetical protein Q9170_000252 [Blastenia crenularia]
MPALGSSIINKSAKKLAPKAPTRRPAAVNSTQTSARASVERSQPTLTSHPEAFRQTAKWPNLAPSQIPRVETHIAPQEPEPPEQDDGLKRKRTPDHVAVGEKTIDAQSSSLNRDGSSSTQIQRPATAMSSRSDRSFSCPSQSRSSTPLSKHISLNHTPYTNTQDLAEAPSDLSPRQFSAAPPAKWSGQGIQPELAQEDVPPAKRRKTRPDRFTKPSASQDQPSLEVHVTQPSTEVNDLNAAPRKDSRASNVQDGPAKPARAKRSSLNTEGKKRQEKAGANEAADPTSDRTRRGNDAQKGVKVRKPRKATTAANRQRLQDAAAEIVADAVEGTATRRQGRRGRNAREPTPGEAENEMIAPGRIKMADLCKDTRKGKKSDMLKALQERDKEELVRKAQQELQQLMETGEPRNPEGSGGPAASGEAENSVAQDVVERQEDVLREVADTYVDEHGQIRIDTDSLRIDRHAQAAAARDQGQQEAVVENDLSRPAVNSLTHLKREKVNSWPEALTDEFYEALQMLGTDFGMIGRMLRKTRRAIKLKFNREERTNPARINQALLGTRIAVDLDEYSRRAGENIKETEEHERKMEEDRKEIEENAADELKAKEEQEQLRREQVEKERAAIPDDSSGKENRDAGRKKKKGKSHGGEKKKKSRREKRGDVAVNAL